MNESAISRPIITILTPVYNEEEALPYYVQALTQTLFSQNRYEFRILFVDDGSTDQSWKMLRQICKEDSRFQAIRLSRNFGPHAALSAGLQFAEGDAVATLACDLQDPPQVILEFLEKWEQGARIVWGARRSRQDPKWRIMASHVFHALVQRFAMPKGVKFTTGSFFLLDRRVVECFRQFQEHNRITFALVAWTGFDQAVVDYDRKQRIAGVSGWTLGRMIKSMYDTFLGFSHLPIRLMTSLGLGMSAFTLPLSFYLVATWMLGNPAPGWTSLFLGLVFFFGIQFLLMGVVGEYLHRIYLEVVRRPLFFVQDEIISSPTQAKKAA